MSGLVFDVELATCVPDYDGSRMAGYTYCAGWRDFLGMEIACIGAMTTDGGVPQLWSYDLAGFWEEVTKYTHVVTFNGDQFDIPLLQSKRLFPLVPSYDILAELWKAAGLDPMDFQPRSHGGFGLERIARDNLGVGKILSGAQAPREWQDGHRSRVYNYCLHDVWLTRELYALIELGVPLVTKVGPLTLPRPSALYGPVDDAADSADAD